MWHLTCYFASQVNAWREDVIGKIEHLAAQLCDSGKCTQWFANADSHIEEVLHLSLVVASSVFASMLQVCAMSTDLCSSSFVACAATKTQTASTH